HGAPHLDHPRRCSHGDDRWLEPSRRRPQRHAGSAFAPMTEAVLEISDLVVEFASEDGPLRAVDTGSFSICRGAIVGLVGESGSGKTLTSEAILGLLRCPPGRVRGQVRFR